MKIAIIFLLLLGLAIWFIVRYRKSMVLEKRLCFFLLVTILCEVVIFNFRHWESMFFPEEFSVSLEDVNISREVKDEIIVLNGEYWLDIEIPNINDVTKNIYLDLNYVNQDGEELDLVMPIRIKGRDTGNELYMEYPRQEIYNDIEKCRYIRLNLSGITKSISLAIENPNGAYGIRMGEITLNTEVPLNISYFRIFGLLLLLIGIYILRPGSKVYEIKLSDSFKYKNHIIGGVMFVLCAIITLLSNINPQYNINNYYTQYHKLAEAMLEGKVYLADVPADSLLEMENPYDEVYRNKVLKENGEKYFVDYALYDGKYYVYFGVLPVLLFFLPYYAITQTHMPVPMSISICGCFLVFATFFLMKAIMERWFPKVSFVNYLQSSVLIIVGSGLFYAFRGPQHYALPILLAAVLAIAGLGFWISSMKAKEISWWRIFIGTFLIALTALSRPQFLIVAFFAVVLFYSLFFEKPFFSKNKIKYMSAFAIPLIVVGLCTMYYNYIRFDSVFDFGANYNLTVNDMTSRGIHFDRTFLGFFYYLLEPTTLTPSFPFVKASTVTTNYMGETIVEGMFGGFLFVRPLLLITPFFFGMKKFFPKDKQVFYFGVLVNLFAYVIVFADTQMAGLIGRYIMDFGWMLCIVGVLIFNKLFLSSDNQVVKKFLIVSIMLTNGCSLIYEFLLLFNSSTNSVLQRHNPYVYYLVKSIMQFW